MASGAVRVLLPLATVLPNREPPNEAFPVANSFRRRNRGNVVGRVERPRGACGDRGWSRRPRLSCRTHSPANAASTRRTGARQSRHAPARHTPTEYRVGLALRLPLRLLLEAHHFDGRARAQQVQVLPRHHALRGAVPRSSQEAARWRTSVRDRRQRRREEPAAGLAGSRILAKVFVGLLQVDPARPAPPR